MPFDVIEVHSPGNAVDLVKIFQITVEMAVVDDPSKVAFEMSVIHGIEPDEGDEETPVRLGDLRAEEITAIDEALLHPIERFEEPAHSPFVSGLRCGESGAVHTVVHLVVQEGVPLVDVPTQRFGIEIEAAVR